MYLDTAHDGIMIRKRYIKSLETVDFKSFIYKDKIDSNRKKLKIETFAKSVSCLNKSVLKIALDLFVNIRIGRIVKVTAYNHLIGTFVFVLQK